MSKYWFEIEATQSVEVEAPDYIGALSKLESGDVDSIIVSSCKDIGIEASISGIENGN